MTTDTDSVKADARAVLPVLWGAYIAALVIACGFFAAFVMTHYWVHLASALAALLWGWIITKPLDAARREVAS